MAGRSARISALDARLAFLTFRSACQSARLTGSGSGGFLDAVLLVLSVVSRTADAGVSALRLRLFACVVFWESEIGVGLSKTVAKLVEAAEVALSWMDGSRSGNTGSFSCDSGKIREFVRVLIHPWCVQQCVKCTVFVR